MVMSDKAQRQLRNWLMFGAALAGTAYEALVQQGDRPFLLTLYASMMGLPVFLGSKDGKGGDPG